jgi:pimeloyl-ACP methyl ester carboxylesterase
VHRREFMQSASLLPALSPLQRDARGAVQDRREELITARTQDDLVHAGLLVTPAAQPNPIAIIWVHGASANFYVPSYVEIARASASRGHAFFSVNTRMHDFGSVLAFRDDGNLRGGAYWGLPSKEPLDIAAWIDRAVESGYRRVVLVGHSAGGGAVRGYQAERNDPRVIGIVMASVGLGPAPTRPDPDLLKTADDMIAKGRGQDFLPNLRLSAQTYADFGRTPLDVWDFYGVEGTPNPAIARVRCPLLAWFGSNDVGTAADLERLRALIARQKTGPAQVDTQIIEGADHLYTGFATRIAETLVTWIRQVSSTV